MTTETPSPLADLVRAANVADQYIQHTSRCAAWPAQTPEDLKRCDCGADKAQADLNRAIAAAQGLPAAVEAAPPSVPREVRELLEAAMRVIGAIATSEDAAVFLEQRSAVIARIDAFLAHPETHPVATPEAKEPSAPPPDAGAGLTYPNCGCAEKNIACVHWLRTVAAKADAGAGTTASAPMEDAARETEPISDWATSPVATADAPGEGKQAVPAAEPAPCCDFAEQAADCAECYEQHRIHLPAHPHGCPDRDVRCPGYRPQAATEGKPLTLERIDALWPGAQLNCYGALPPSGSRLWLGVNGREMIRSPNGQWSRFVLGCNCEELTVTTEADLREQQAWLHGTDAPSQPDRRGVTREEVEAVVDARIRKVLERTQRDPDAGPQPTLAATGMLRALDAIKAP